MKFVESLNSFGLTKLKPGLYDVCKGTLYSALRRFWRLSGRVRSLFQRSVVLGSAAQRIDKIILISQLQRSGGTLMFQLFDSHPEIATFPYELNLGRPMKWNWPGSDAFRESPERYVNAAFTDELLMSYMVKGLSSEYRGGDTVTYPFKFDYYQFWRDMRAVGKPESFRVFLLNYFNSFFRAWKNYKKRGLPARHCLFFVPRLILDEQSMDTFTAEFPGNTIITVFRNPAAWYASAKKHDTSLYSDIDTACQLYNDYANSVIRCRAIPSCRVIVVDFDDLVDDSLGVVNKIEAELGLKISNKVSQTLNSVPVVGNSSFAGMKPGIDKNSASRYKLMLSNEEIDQLRALTGEAYGALSDMKI
jgi:hypothetical protein